MTSINTDITLNILARLVVLASLFVLLFHASILLTDGEGLPGATVDYSGVPGLTNNTETNTTTPENTSNGNNQTVLAESTKGTVTNVSTPSTLTVDINGNATTVHVAGVASPALNASAVNATRFNQSASEGTRECLAGVSQKGVSAVRERYGGETVVVWPTVGESVTDGEVSAYVYPADGASEMSVTMFLVKSGNGFGVVQSAARPQGLGDQMWTEMQNSHQSSMELAKGGNSGVWSC